VWVLIISLADASKVVCLNQSSTIGVGSHRLGGFEMDVFEMFTQDADLY